MSLQGNPQNVLWRTLGLSAAGRAWTPAGGPEGSPFRGSEAEILESITLNPKP